MTIQDNDLPTLSIANANVMEGNSANVTVSLSSAPFQPVTVNYITSDGTANADVDYNLTSGTLTFNRGETTKVINVPVIRDSIVEGSEIFQVSLFDSTNANLDINNIATVNVQDYVGEIPANTSTPAVFDFRNESVFRGTIDTSGDQDWIVANLTAGTRYQIELRGSSTREGTLGDPYLRGIYNSSGTSLGYADDDSGTGNNSLTSFTATYTGIYYISAGGFSSSTGSYVLDIT